MTHDNDLPPDLQRLGLDLDELDGHTIDELSDYLDSDRVPADPSIDNSPGCQLALQAMERLRTLSRSLIDADVAAAPVLGEGWVERILDSIAFDARAGRRIPIEHPSATADLGITEGAVRGLIRAAEADVGGVVVGRCRLAGDVAIPGAPVTVSVDASVLWGQPIPENVRLLRNAIAKRLSAHTQLNVVAIDVTIHDIHHLPFTPEENRS
ncbi:MAG TPA: hypothetical protein VGC18_14405 [Lacisediminihabitans sp.]|uniref:hypothetical protein n=1 Tax=Lacisediminihabitans sp. TaxID=2787631 RepID=UPI002ED78E55